MGSTTQTEGASTDGTCGKLWIAILVLCERKISNGPLKKRDLHFI